MKIHTLEERIKELQTLMDYAVPKENRREADELVEKYAADIIAVNLFSAFYGYLPDAEDDAVNRLRLIDQRQGNFLICASTLNDDYVYIVSIEGAEFLGNAADGIWDEEILDFFGFPDREAFIRACDDLDKFEEFQPTCRNTELCPACSVASGEHHTFGCPVEICPWCEGQMINCDCRFTQLGVEVFNTESHVEELLRRLEERGRVPFNAAEHRPTYLTEEVLEKRNKS